MTVALKTATRMALAVSLGLASLSADALGAADATWVAPDAPAVPLFAAQPAGGPLDRHARPGGWYRLLALPVAPGVPFELVLWPPRASHAVRLVAFDAPPDAAPSYADPLPWSADAAPRARGGRAPPMVARLVSPSASPVQVVWVLVEQWAVAGRTPLEPLWASSRPWRGDPARAAWWTVDGGGASRALSSPPSPLSSATGPASGLHVLPVPAVSEPGPRR